MSVEFTDRYKALGIPYPDPKAVCKGPCEGVGVYPKPRAVNPDGTIDIKTDWDLVTCEVCKGTGKAAGK